MLGKGRRCLAVATVLLGVTALPAASADHEVLHYAQGLADEAGAYAQDVSGQAAGILPACSALGYPWTVSCTDGATVVACGFDSSVLHRCRLIFEGSGGDVDGAAAALFANAASSAANVGYGRATAGAGRLAGAGTGVANVALSEAVGWQSWTTGTLVSFTALALAAKQPYQDAAMGLRHGVQTGTTGFVTEAGDDAEAAVLSAVNNGAAPDYRITAEFDSGPVTVHATDKRPADDPCSPGTGLRVFGSDCRGPMFFDADVRAAAECNAYTSIALRQPCGGHVSGDWNWQAQGTPLYPRQLQAARLAFGPDGRATVHDAGGVLHCNAPRHQNGYWVQSLSVSVSESTFDEQPLGHEDANSLALFGDDAGTCAVEWHWWGYRVTYDVTFNGVPMRATGTFSPEGPAQQLAGCSAGADTRTPGFASCSGVVHTGG
jgi:hypothetical protein